MRGLKDSLDEDHDGDVIEHQVLYHGVFANNAKYRRLVLPKYREPVKKHRWLKLTKRGNRDSKHVSWAELLYRAFGVRGWVCDQCGCRMTLRAVVVGEYAVSRMIKGFLWAGLFEVRTP